MLSIFLDTQKLELLEKIEIPLCIDLDINVFYYIIRVFIALLCGSIIGWERMNRSKDAGIKTHAIVCMSSAIIMIVSKYGFTELLCIPIEHSPFRGDPARLAAQVISGIGFLGAGVIFYRKDFLHGLTTAAGIWLTGAIGLAIGSGMVIVGLCATILLLIFQVCLHYPIQRLKARNNMLKISLRLKKPSDLERIKEILAIEKFNEFKSSIDKDGFLNIEVQLNSKHYSSEADILKLLNENKEIVYIERILD